MQIEVNRDCVVATGSTEEIMEALFGPAQHDEHCKGWRWHLYMRDVKRGMRAVDDEVRKMIAERRSRESREAA